MKAPWLLIGSAAMASAGLYLAAVIGSLGSLMLAVLTPLPLFLVGLSLGGRAAALTGAAAAIVVAAASTLWGGFLFLLAYAGPVAILSDRAGLSRNDETDPSGKTREWYPPGLLAVWLVVIPIVVVLIVFLYSLARGDGMQAMVTRLVEPFVAFYQSAYGTMLPGSKPPTPHQLEVIEALIVHAAPAMLALGCMLTVMLNGILAQGLLTRFGRNLRPSPRMSEIEIPRPMVVAFTACFLVGITIGGASSYLGTTLAGILAFPLFLSGLGVAHAAADRTKVRLGILFMVYTVLVISRWATPAVVILGLIDHFAGLKARMRARANST